MAKLSDYLGILESSHRPITRAAEYKCTDVAGVV